MAACLLCLVLFAFRPIWAQDNLAPVPGSAVETPETDLARKVSGALKRDAALRRSLAQRILQSSLAARLSDAGDPGAEANQIEDWIYRHPEDAAHLQIGFAKDDANGARAFEHALHERVVRYFELNPKREQGILGVLEQAGSQSKFVLGHGGKLDIEEQRELLKRIFEGRGPGGQRVLQPPKGRPSGDAQPGAGGLPVSVGPGIYDRLSVLNPTGYSPEVLALQNSLNAQNIPGAPDVPETGRLNYETLAFPYYLLRSDWDRVNFALQADLARQTGPGQTPNAARGSGRKKSLDLAASALEKLQKEAGQAKQPSRISLSLLRSLGRRQKEAARWITAASLEEDLERLESLPLRWPQELLEKIRTAPADEAVRQRYLLEGPRLLDRLARVKEADSGAIAALQSPDFLSRWEEAQKRLAQAAPLRRDLQQDMALYARLPYLLADAFHPKPWWKAFCERWIMRLAPNTSCGRRLLEEERRWRSLQAAFGQVASGDYAPAEARNL